MSDLREDLAAYFVSKGTATGLGVDVFLDSWPESPDSVIVINEYASSEVPSQIDCTHRSIQIVVRDSSDVIARQRAYSLHASLRAEDSYVDLTSTRWAMVYLREVPHLLKEDDQHRRYYFFNVGITATYDDE